jgi:hypothetical protein
MVLTRVVPKNGIATYKLTFTEQTYRNGKQFEYNLNIHSMIANWKGTYTKLGYVRITNGGLYRPPNDNNMGPVTFQMNLSSRLDPNDEASLIDLALSFIHEICEKNPRLPNPFVAGYIRAVIEGHKAKHALLAYNELTKNKLLDGELVEFPGRGEKQLALDGAFQDCIPLNILKEHTHTSTTGIELHREVGYLHFFVFLHV